METGSLQSLFVILFIPRCRISMRFSIPGYSWDKKIDWSKLVIFQFNTVVVESFDVILTQTKQTQTKEFQSSPIKDWRQR